MVLNNINKNNDRPLIFSFSLNPMLYQPSGSCNMSRIDSNGLKFVYGVNNNDSKIGRNTKNQNNKKKKRKAKKIEIENI